MALSRTDYIRYLTQEAIRKGVHKHANFYSELIKFIDTPEGQAGFSTFKELDPTRIGIQAIPIHSFMKAF